MVRYAFVAMVGLASALPLNINLGAYSPALVVVDEVADSGGTGDGEISFGGNQDVSNLMNVLEGAAVNTAANVANNAAKAATATSSTVTNEVPAAGNTANNAVVTNAAAPPAGDPLIEQAQQIASLQGLGNKEIAPRVQLIDVEAESANIEDVEEVDADSEAAESPVAKRDLAGFDRALTFAEAALTKGPKVQLGTGREGSGVGIIVENGPTVATAGVAAGEKRDVSSSSSSSSDSSPKRVRAKVTTMYVRSGIPASLQSKRDDVTGPRSVPGTVIPSAPTFSRRDAIDAVNLNVDGDQGLTMTFVETVEDTDDE
ncbi:hypothetical protein SCUCBS95973_005344 [Sporothrix curviconia]|uniref:Uncharacterized protein n=1 Tax=Sporothrix curviconia TaxID=1260050 RepID=A0ABP0BYA3_9PEZI